MCQMCEEYEAELRRMGLTAEADQIRAERHRDESSGGPPEAGPTRVPDDDKQ
jgi:hypothetical protein